MGNVLGNGNPPKPAPPSERDPPGGTGTSLSPLMEKHRPCSHDFIGEFSTSYRELERGQSRFNVYEVRGGQGRALRHGVTVPRLPVLHPWVLGSPQSHPWVLLSPGSL